MGAFAYRIKDLGAAGGYMVTPIGFQDGADKIAKYEGIHEIRLDADSTATDFTVEFLDKVVHGRSATLKLNLRISATASVRKAEPKDG